METSTTPPVAQVMYRALEPIHALVYFAPERREIYVTAGLKGQWMGYFASRAAAFGPVPPQVVEATFYFFAPVLVYRAIPDAWAFATPQRILQARLEVVDTMLRRVWGDTAHGPAVAEAAALARTATQALTAPGRPLYAAQASLPWPEEPHLALWHAQNLLREHRGDGHVATLLRHGVGPCEALALHGAVSAYHASLGRLRGWTEDQWAAAEASLEDRGWLDGDGAITAEGRAARDAVERDTDALATAAWEHLGPERCTRLRALAAPLVAALSDG